MADTELVNCYLFLHKEDARVKEEDLARSPSGRLISWTVYVGGQPGDFLVGGGYVGCISALRINQRHLELIDASEGMTGRSLFYYFDFVEISKY